VLLGLLLDRLWQAPLRQLTATASQIASGDLAARADISGPQELARLGLALNDMRESLARQIQTIRAKGQDLQTVVGNLDEGVIALDAAGRVLVLNRAAADMFGVGKPDGTPEGTPPEAVGPVGPGLHLRAAVSTAGIVDAYNEAVASGQAVSRQFECQRDGKRMILAVQAVPLPGAGAIAGMLVARDVTELVRTAGAKAEFVATASQELRTPRATVRAAVDSLADQAGDEAAVTRLAAMLDRHVARLEGLTNDLLDLHLVESKTGPLRLEDILLAELSDWAGAQFARAAGDKGLDLGVSAESPGRIRSDRKLLELILRNLLENAVKFTPPGGLVRCRMSCRQGGAVFSVQDTGCGIGAQDQQRVFERFFQADAARGGPQTRGTGLGLAIVKHAAERLGAKVELESQLGRGTTVTVTVPGCVA
jgi:signal transduction histidine kinase/HAMP domain-containing protein